MKCLFSKQMIQLFVSKVLMIVHFTFNYVFIAELIDDISIYFSLLLFIFP